MTNPSDLVRISTNEVTAEYHYNRHAAASVSWKTPGLQITRLRMVSDAGFPYWDISYCHGKLNGEDVDVELPFHQIPKKWAKDPNGWGKGFIINIAKQEGVYAKDTGIFEAFSQCQA